MLGLLSGEAEKAVNEAAQQAPLPGSRPRVLLAVPLPDDLLERLKATCDVVISPSGVFPTRADLLAAIADVDGVATTVMCRFDRELFARAPRLKAIAQCGVGLDHIDLAAASERGIAVANTPGVQNEAVAEMALAMVFALARNLASNDAFVRRGEWLTRQAPLAVNVAGARIGLIGMGGIGRALARMAAGVGMEVVYNKPSRDQDSEAAGVATYLPFDELLQSSDFVSLHLPLSEATRGMIGHAELARMKPGSFLINTARGAIVDEGALVEALRSGHLAGAGLDVMTHEPLAPDHPLASFANVILQPHAGGATKATRRAMEEQTVANLEALLSGRRPDATINPGVPGNATNR